MSNNELLAIIDEELESAIYAKQIDHWDSIAPIKALRAVVELAETQKENPAFLLIIEIIEKELNK